MSRLPSFSVLKNYGSPTRESRLKVAPNMADPISIKYLLPNTDSFVIRVYICFCNIYSAMNYLLFELIS